tara:strand:- start:675 stop:1103 length:429 start_codon:yes stop_codon:yes gene_type:complete
MINSSEFSKRLEKVIKFYDETASSFAEKVGVQRSSISHILSGRNKPSLDFVMKVLDTFPDVELYWLLNGKGTFPKTEMKPTSDSIIKTQEQEHDPLVKIHNPKEVETNQTSKNIESLSINNSKEIDRIVIFFKDGTFKNYTH